MVLKFGTKGKEVKELQEFLGIPADGIFGKKTEDAVKKWQSSKGLVADGIVGPATWDSMGLASTDNSEKVYFTEGGLAVQRYFLPEKEFKKGPIKPRWCFLHHTAGWHNPFSCIDSWAKDTRGAIATEFVLGGPSVRGNDDRYDGTLVQAFPAGNYGWHLGANGSQEMHINSVGIEVCNFGYIVNGKTYTGASAHVDQIVTLKKPFRGHLNWHRYSDNQIATIKKWLEWVAERDGIDIRSGLPDLVKKKGEKAFEFNKDAFSGKIPGLWSHTNIRKDKFDMFPQQELLDLLVSL